MCASRRTSTAPTTPCSSSPTATRCSSTSTTARFAGARLDQLRAEFGRPTFVFKSYSFAQAYPACYTADDPADLELITRDSYLDDWIGVVSELEPGLRRAVRQHGRVPAPREPPGQPLPRSRRATWSPSSRSGRRGASTEAVQMDPGRPLERRRRASSAGASTGTPTARQRLDELARRVQPRIDAQTAAEEGDDARLRHVRRVLRGLPARVPARHHRPLRAPAPGGVRGAVVATAVLGDRLPPPRGLPAVAAAARHREHRARERSGARRRDRQAPGPRRARLDAHRHPPPPRRRRRRHHVLGAARAVGARLRPAARIASSRRLAEVGWRRRREWLDWTDALRGGSGGSLFERLSGRFTTSTERAASDSLPVHLR